MKHKFSIGDQVVFTNCFGVCWGVKEIIALDERTNRPTYHYKDSDTPWFSVGEEHFRPADNEDLIMMVFDDLSFFQIKYGFIPTEWYGCW